MQPLPSAPGDLPPPVPLRLSEEAAERIRMEVNRAGGREVSFLTDVGEDRTLRNARAVARGNRTAVLAASRDAPQGSVMVHNHPSGDLEPSDADLSVAAALFESGVGSVIVDNRASRLYVVVEPPPPRVVVPLDLEVIEGFMGGAVVWQESSLALRIGRANDPWHASLPASTTKAEWVSWRLERGRASPWPISFLRPSGP